jgi:hypothetical protein
MFGITKKCVSATKIGGIQITSCIIDDRSSEAVNKLMLGASYGHTVKLGKYYALYHLPISIKGSLRDTEQLWFQKVETTQERLPNWEWTTVLYPDRVVGEHKELLVCSDKKRRSKEKITVQVTADTIEVQEAAPIEVEIE